MFCCFLVFNVLLFFFFRNKNNPMQSCALIKLVHVRVFTKARPSWIEETKMQIKFIIPQCIMCDANRRNKPSWIEETKMQIKFIISQCIMCDAKRKKSHLGLKKHKMHLLFPNCIVCLLKTLGCGSWLTFKLVSADFPNDYIL